MGIDAKAGFVATEGWLETSNVDWHHLGQGNGKDVGNPLVHTDVDWMAH